MQRLSASILCPLLILTSALSAWTAPFPPLVNSETDLSKPLMPAQEVVRTMQLPEGFSATVFAAEPQVQNPIAMSWDGRGRLWVVENFTYAERAKRFDLSLRDRVLIFEDTDGDGRADVRRVFTDEVQMLTGLCVGRGGVWLMCPPQLLFVPDADADGTPDAAPRVVLDGFTVARDNYHNFANGLKWGPDGWLYGRVGHSCPGNVGRPGTPEQERVPLDGAVWRYHPERGVFESINSGTTNPWGHDWDRHGELFFINTVNGHLWHSIPGAHYRGSFSLNPNRHVYGTIDQHADHYHFDTGRGWTASRDGSSGHLGGGHAHIGMLIYQGGLWPQTWQDRLLTVNMHGRRVNVDRLEREGSGYVGRHEADLLQVSDAWFRGIDLSTGPDGNVLLIDWSDTGECHDNTGVHRESGRIYKISYGAGKGTREAAPANLQDLSAETLAGLHAGPNEWQVREARRLLHERVLAGKDVTGADAVLRAQLKGSDAVLRLRALWTLWLTGGVEAGEVRGLLRDADEHLRTWAVRLLTDKLPLDLRTGVRPARAEVGVDAGLLEEFTRMAREDSSGLVRLALASTLQRMPLEKREGLAIALAGRAEDASDHNLPLLVWYGLMPVADRALGTLEAVARASAWPDLRRFIGRRMAEELTTRRDVLDGILRAPELQDAVRMGDVLQGVSEALAGVRKAPMPGAWKAVQARLASTSDPQLRDRVRELATLFGDGRALEEVRRIALDGKAEPDAREAALRSLIDARPEDLRSVCERLLEVRHLNLTAVRGLALFEDPQVAEGLVKAYRRFQPAGRRVVLDTLVSRPGFAKVLLEHVGETQVPRGDITAFHARQIRSFQDAQLSARLTEVWGEWREASQDRARLIAQWRAKLAPEVLAKADLGRGRALFQGCSSCHKLYGEGGEVGPDLTGSGRGNLDYLLENILDPSGVVAPEYRMVVLTLKDGRVLTGMVSAQNAATLTLRGLNDAQVVERSAVAKQEVLPVSMMPEGLLQAMDEEQVRDLMGYLMHPTQVALPWK